MTSIRNARRWLGLLVPLVMACLWPVAAGAQGASELRAFNAAYGEFEDANWVLAEKELADFIKAFPESPRLPEAVLYQAEAALKQKKSRVAIGLLSTNAVSAGPLADQYRYWLAEAFLQGTNYQAAADACVSLMKDFPNSNLLLAASYDEALARFKLKDWPRVIQLLQGPDGTFRKEARLRPADELTSRGILLLAEALLEHGDFRAAQDGLGQLTEQNLTPEFKWRRQYVLCRVQLAARRLPEALANTTNLLALAASSGDLNLLAHSVALQGGILEQFGDADAAVQVYAKNLAEGVPADSARQALLKITGLTLAQNRVNEAVQKLESFLAKHPEDAGSDVVLLTLGELHLKQHFANLENNRSDAAVIGTPAVTNHLQQALLNFEKVITNSPSGPLAGRALLDKGWVLWADGKIAQSLPVFQLAAEQLPRSPEKAVARFKAGEAQFYQKDYTNAILSFRSILKDFSDLPQVKDSLFDQALYQIVRASLELGDLVGASDAMSKILGWYPGSFFSDRSMLLVGQQLTLARRPSDARQVFLNLVARFPGSALAPEVELAVARTYVQENDWAAAIGEYEKWLERFGNSALRPQVEFNRAWATYKSGAETNALALFTNFVARFPTHELAARAQFLVGSFYFNQKDYEAAEKNFQDKDKILLLNTNFAYQALMWAGRAAIARQGWADAAGYFKRLIEDNNCPPDVKAEAYFGLGDTLTWQAPDPANPLKKYEEAEIAFKKIPTLYPSSRLVANAWGRIGDCYLQLATEDSKQYDLATKAYQAVLTNAADVVARSKAEVGLGVGLEAIARSSKSAPEIAALLDAAYTHYANVVYEKILLDGETSDPFWLEKAGLAAGKLAEERKQWEVAGNLYARLLGKLPPLRDLLSKRIEKARSEQERVEKK